MNSIIVENLRRIWLGGAILAASTVVVVSVALLFAYTPQLLFVVSVIGLAWCVGEFYLQQKDNDDGRGPVDRRI